MKSDNTTIIDVTKEATASEIVADLENLRDEMNKNREFGEALGVSVAIRRIRKTYALKIDTTS